jgi:RimJ/RimL family protein N-acetyltransferase
VKAPSHIETGRLVLSVPGATDAEAIFSRYASDSEVTHYLGWPRHETMADTEGFLAFSNAQWQQNEVGPYLIRRQTDGQLLGGTGLGRESGGLASTGYVLARDAWGAGYATEVLRAMVDVAGGIDVVRIYALCHPDHRASWRVLEKCGFRRDVESKRPTEFPNLARGVLQDALYYSRAL